MRYSITELIENSSLQNTLLSQPFTIQDHSGLLSQVNFQNGDLQSDAYHIINRVANGCDVMCDMLIEGGMKSLTTDPNAGGVPVRHLDNYYINTNTSRLTLFNDILIAVDLHVELLMPYDEIVFFQGQDINNLDDNDESNI